MATDDPITLWVTHSMLFLLCCQVGSKLTISVKGHVKVGRTARDEVFWGEVEPPTLTNIPIISADDSWVRYGKGRNDRFRNVRVAGGFLINSTELRAVNFSMEALGRPAVQPRKGGRRAAVVSAPLPKRYRMHRDIDAEIRGRCW